MGYAFFLFQEADDTLLGGLTLSNVRRGVTQAAAVGYWVGNPYAGRGYMTRALAGAVRFAFDELKLHRVEAACMPNNLASIRVLERNRFQREGLARRYLNFQRSRIREARTTYGARFAAVLGLFLRMVYAAELAVEAAKWLLGHKRRLRARRIGVYWRVVREL